MMIRNAIFSTVLILACLFCGCKSGAEVYVIRTWEGHFKNVEDFHKATENIELQKGESVWVLSNKTLLKTLQNAK